MVVIGVGYLSYFFPILKDPLVLTITCVVVLWIFVLLNIVGPKMITRVQAVATVLALIPIVGIAVFGTSAAWAPSVRFKVPLTLRCGRSSVWKVPPLPQVW